MIKYSSKEFEKITKEFPGLRYEEKKQKILGYIDIGPCHYTKKYSARIAEWEIKKCKTSDKECITGEYLIEIDLSGKDRFPPVYEVGGKIKKLAEELNKDIIDLHIYPYNYRCCLEICIDENSLSGYIFYYVYPYFVWQSYYKQYRKKPPCGEWKHGHQAHKQASDHYKEIIECYKGQITGCKTGRNDQCPCGSNKKYKKCCLSKDEACEKKINPIQRKVRILEKFIKSKKDTSQSGHIDKIAATNNNGNSK